MLSAFPNLFTYGILVPLFFRVYLGFFLWRLAVSDFKKSRSHEKSSKFLILALVQFILGAALLVGFMTQISALILTLGILVKLGGFRRDGAIQARTIDFYTLLFLVSLALVFLGPGLWSIDLPL
jgi:uncharacterized membrane protein YphA (DoxX/SURF4 family)